jgi:hypothetical protein
MKTFRFGLFFGFCLGATDIEIDLLRGRIHLAGGLLLVRHGVVHAQRLPVPSPSKTCVDYCNTNRIV